MSALLLFILVSAAPASAGTIVPLAADGASSQSETPGLCVGCQVIDEENVISDDLDAYATLSLPLSIASSLSLSVDYGRQMSRTTKPGFVIGNGGILDVSVLSGIRLTTYRNGVEQETAYQGSGITLQIFSGGNGRVFMRATKPYDEIRITAEGLIGLAREVRVYHAIAITRNGVTRLDFPTNAEDGVTAAGSTNLVCSLLPACRVSDPDAVVSTDRNESATVRMGIGVLSSGTIDVFFPEDQVDKNRAGFVVKADGGMLDLSLLSAITITTFRDGIVQQTTSGSGLQLVSRGAAKRLVLGKAGNPFDQVRITMSAVVGVDVRISVYHAAVQYIDRTHAGSLDLEQEAPESTSLTTADVEPLALSAPAPNPATNSARLALSAATAQHVRVIVYDARGREVATPFDGMVSPNEPVDVTVARGDLPSGVYIVRAQGEQNVATQRLTLVR